MGQPESSERMHLTESPAPLPAAPGFPWTTAIHKRPQTKPAQLMKSDKDTARGSVVARFTRTLVQESGNPLLSKTNTSISIVFYSIISSHSDKASVLGYWKAIQETANVCPNEYKGYYISKQLT